MPSAQLVQGSLIDAKALRREHAHHLVQGYDDFEIDAPSLLIAPKVP
ncbi:MAG TPA: hypothetical protein VFN74_04240 [Chloroflexota bacterium]|nr:hypothetical protein [Chloroflexota bacterium]